MKKILSVGALSLVILLSAFSNSSFALTKGFQAISLYPATDGGPYIGIWGSRNLDQLKFEAGTLAVYAYKPMELITDGTPVRSILNSTIVQHFYAHMGLVDQWLSMGFDVPMGWWAKFLDPNVAGATYQNKTVIGDIYINLKSEFLRTKYFGIALRPFVTIPTGYGRYFFGNGTVTGGGTLIVEAKPLDIWSLSLNASVLGRQAFQFRDIDKSTQLELGFGTAVQVAKPVSIVAEVGTSTRLSGIFKKKTETPTEARGAVKWAISDSGFMLSAGGTGGILRGSGAPTYSVFAGLGFSPTRRSHRSSIVTDKINFSDYTVYFAPNSSVVSESKEAQKMCDLSDKIRDKNIKVKVTGFADSTTVERHNKGLSKDRAEKAGWFLRKLGIDKSLIKTLENSSSEAGRKVEFERTKDQRPKTKDQRSKIKDQRSKTKD